MFSIKKLSALMLLIVSFIIVSCSEDNSTSSNTNKDYFPTTVGSYWKFLTYELDSMSIRIPGTEDTTIEKIVGTETLYGKNAIIYVTSSSKNTGTDTTYFAKEGTKVYTLLSLFNNDFIPIEQGNQWVQIADFSLSPGNQWTILNDTTLATVDIPPDIGVSGKMTPTISIKARRGENTTFTIKGKPVNATEFIITFGMVIKLNVSGMPMPINLNFNVVNHIWFGEGIGIVRRQTDPFSINVIIQNFNFNGSRDELIDYSIK